MYWILLLIAVSLTLILIATVPQNILRTAIENCTRADGSKSVRRRQRESKSALSFLSGIVVIPLILIAIHVSATMMVEHFYVVYVPEEWVAKIEWADTVEGSVSEAMAEFSEWRDQQQAHDYDNKASWQEAIWDNWMYFIADALLMGIVVYYFLGPYYLLLVSNFTKGVERRHRVYVRIDSKRSARNQDEYEESPKGDDGTGEEIQDSASDKEEHIKAAISPFTDLNDYIRELSRKGFLDAVFTGLQIPDKQLSRVQNKDTRRAAVENNIDQADKKGNSHTKSPAGQNNWRESASEGLRKVENELKALRTSQAVNGNNSAAEILALERQIKELNHKIDDISLSDIDESSARGGNDLLQPTTKAVLFCLMDISCSMEGEKIAIAKRIFILFFLFLQRNHAQLEVVYIQHHATARELDEDGFFESRHKSGTVISSSLELLCEIVQERFSDPQCKIYAAQISDGENRDGDSPHCRDILMEKILPLLQYYIYVETVPGEGPTLGWAYEILESDYENFAMQRIDEADSLYAKFRALFDKRLN
jgi:uncharacterized sporulation protein YeaH/YhbH (DUF444 family)